MGLGFGRLREIVFCTLGIAWNTSLFTAKSSHFLYDIYSRNCTVFFLCRSQSWFSEDYSHVTAISSESFNENDETGMMRSIAFFSISILIGLVRKSSAPASRQILRQLLDAVSTMIFGP